MKRFLSLALAAVLFLGLFTAMASCTEKTYEIALVTDVGNIDDKSFNEGAWNGVKEFAEDNDISYGYFRPANDTTADRISTIEQAINKGAKVIVCPGYLFEDAIYDVQDKYPAIMFLLLDGQPHTADYTVYKTSENVHCILYQEEQAGYLAGYAAVKEGYRSLGFLGGMSVPAVIRYGYGFVQGANAAAVELNCADSVTIKYWYSGTFNAEDTIKVKMSGWYSDGTEIVFACGGKIYQSCLTAADETDKKLIGVDVDQYNESPRIVTSAMKGLTNSVVLALKSLYDNKTVNEDETYTLAWDDAHKGITANLGAAADCVGLPTADTSWRFEKYTVAEYNELFAKIKDGTIVVDNSSDKEVKPTVSITVDYQ